LEEIEYKTESEWDFESPPGPQWEQPIDATEGTWLSLDVSPDSWPMMLMGQPVNDIKKAT